MKPGRTDPEKILGISLKDEDDSLYNAMIWALSIGIIIVIATLILTRPKAESFTELYFNNHTSLPEYASMNDTYRYSFTIHNLENSAMEYNYTVSTELYGFDYSCTTPDLYLEEDNGTRSTSTNDPALIIKEDNYNVSFNYDIISGNAVKFGIIGINNNLKYSVGINDNVLTFYQGNTSRSKFLNITNNYLQAHRFKASMNGKNLTIYIDDDNASFNVNDPTHGYPYIETPDTYAEIYSMAITRMNSTENVNVHIADLKYATVTMDKDAGNNVAIQYSRFLANPLYDQVLNTPVIGIQYSNSDVTYTTKTAINLTEYSLKISFRTFNKINILLGNKGITYDRLNKTLTIHEAKDISINVPGLNSWNDINILVKGNNASLYFNNAYVTGLDKLEKNITPVIIGDSNTDVREFSIKDISQPQVLSYKVPTVSQVVTYSSIYTPKVLESIKSEIITPETGGIEANIMNTSQLNDDQKSQLQGFIDREKISWTNYRVIAYYVNHAEAGNFTISMDDLSNILYSVSIDPINKSAKVSYLNDKRIINMTKNIKLSNVNILIIDVNNGSVTMYYNGQNISSFNADSTSGLILLDYSNITLTRAQTEDKDSDAIKVYSRQYTGECKPILINKYLYTNSTNIPDKGAAILSGFTNIQEPFDTAKVQISLNTGEEIHFIMKNI